MYRFSLRKIRSPDANSKTRLALVLFAKISSTRSSGVSISQAHRCIFLDRFYALSGLLQMSMTVGQFMAALSEMDPDLPLVCAVSHGTFELVVDLPRVRQVSTLKVLLTRDDFIDSDTEPDAIPAKTVAVVLIN